MATLSTKWCPLSARLQRLASFVPGSEVCVADIGTDHGQLAAYLATATEHRKLCSVYATDQSPNGEARELFATLPSTSTKIHLRIGDGLKPLVDE